MGVPKIVYWNGFKFVLRGTTTKDEYIVKRDERIIGYVYADSPDEAVEKLRSTFDRAFSKKYRGWRRMFTNHNFSVALGFSKGYDYYHPEAKYVIMRGVKSATVYYIDEDFDYAAFRVNPFKKIEKINRVYSLMYEHNKFITGMRVYRLATEYLLPGERSVMISHDSTGIVGYFSGGNLFESPEEFILYSVGSVL